MSRLESRSSIPSSPCSSFIAKSCSPCDPSQPCDSHPLLAPPPLSVGTLPSLFPVPFSLPLSLTFPLLFPLPLLPPHSPSSFPSRVPFPVSFLFLLSFLSPLPISAPRSLLFPLPPPSPFPSPSPIPPPCPSPFLYDFPSAFPSQSSSPLPFLPAYTYTHTMRSFIGKVVSSKMQKSVVVAVDRFKAHRKYPKVVHSTKKFMAHDESNECAMGDQVCIESLRPLSQRKHWVVTVNLCAKLSCLPLLALPRPLAPGFPYPPHRCASSHHGH
ncbi:unnamed protein product [Closterium sp. NIES-64]|nr:unnamed protein product [Closterium sp. NIES-64]